MKISNNNSLGKIEGDKLIFFQRSKVVSYEIYDIAFFELHYKEIKIYFYFLSIIIILINLIIYYNLKSDFFYFFSFLSIMIWLLNLKIGKKKEYYVLLCFKDFKEVSFSIKRKQLIEANKLIDSYKIKYKDIDELRFSNK